MLMPTPPLPPGRLSTITCWPHSSVSFWPMARAVMSAPPPGTTVMMMRIGRAG